MLGLYSTPKLSTISKLLASISSPAIISSSKAEVLKLSKFAVAEPGAFDIALFKSDIIPAVDVSQYISNLDTVGAVSSIAKFSILL